MGWDSFGLPAENAARINNVDPSEWTEKYGYLPIVRTRCTLQGKDTHASKLEFNRRKCLSFIIRRCIIVLYSTGCK